MFKKYLLFALIAPLLFWSCEDELDGPFLSLGDAPTITAPASGTSFTITEDNIDDVFATFEWTAADFGFDAGIRYQLEYDAAGNNFAEPNASVLVNDLKLTLTNAEVNNNLLSAGYNTTTTFEVRVVASVTNDVEKLYSAPITLEITPFEQEIDYPKLGVPGSYQGWDETNQTTVIYSVNQDGTYEGYLYIGEAGAEHKYVQGFSWDTNWGDTGADGILDPGGDNIVLGDAGVYRFQVNLNDLSYSETRTDWGIIGTATPGGWDSDQDMTVDPVTANWSITLDLVAGEMKFRANDDWAIDFGDTGADGKLDYGGDNIVIDEAGNYTIDLILNQAVYTYVLTKN